MTTGSHDRSKSSQNKDLEKRSHGGSNVTTVLGFVSWKEEPDTRGSMLRVLSWELIVKPRDGDGMSGQMEGRPVKDTPGGRSLLFVSSKDLFPGSL